MTETLFDAFKEGRSVTFSGFSGFYERCVSTRPDLSLFNPGQKLRARFGWSSAYKGWL